MISFGLSAEQRANRRFFAGGSDSPKVCSGDPKQQMEVFPTKGADAPIEPETPDFRRGLQHATEVYTLDYVEEFGCKDPRGIMVIPPGPITRRGEQPTAALHPFIGCTLDGWSAALECPLNVKRLSRWTGKKGGQTALEWAVEKYTVSTIHECIACDALYGYLILVIDEAEPVAVRVDVDPWVAEEMVARLTDFWRCVETRTPPDGNVLPFVPPKIEIAQLRRLNLMNAADQEACNWADEWIDLAHKFAATEPARRANMATREAMKSLMPDDVASIDYGLMHQSRTKSGAVTFKLEETDAE